MNVPKIVQGMRLRFFKSGRPGKGDPSPFSASDMNEHVAVLNAFLNAQIKLGNSYAVYISDGNVIFQIKRSDGSSGGSTITLQTNSVDNPNQEILNLFAGAGITLTANGAGRVTIEGGIRYFGDYAATQAYQAGSIVRIRSGATSGYWIVAPNKVAAANQVPIFPEPTDATWHLFNLGLQAVNVCQGGQKTIYVHASEPF